jgi:hypothetical protein
MLIPNWRDVAKKAWSMRLMALAGLLSGAEVALPYLDGLLPIPPGVFAVLTLITVGAAFVARLVVQQSLTPPIPPSTVTKQVDGPWYSATGPEEYPD